MSVCTTASTPANSAVVSPIPVTTCSAPGATSNIGSSRATRYTPATTMVAAWISALTGVGPSIASGSQTWKGNCALFPIAPRKISSVASVR